MTNPYPHEIAIADVYVSPVILVLLLGFFASVLSVFILNKLKLSKYFYIPSYTFLAIYTLYILLIDHYFIKF
jgi:hypothetical protein